MISNVRETFRNTHSWSQFRTRNGFLRMTVVFSGSSVLEILNSDLNSRKEGKTKKTALSKTTNAIPHSRSSLPDNLTLVSHSTTTPFSILSIKHQSPLVIRRQSCFLGAGKLGHSAVHVTVRARELCVLFIRRRWISISGNLRTCRGSVGTQLQSSTSQV
jgi:hypothetical protein